MQRISALVSCGWLSRILAPETQYLRVLDASWNLPNSDIDAHSKFTKKHIPGAHFFDIEECSLPHSPYSHMLPTPDCFSRYAGNLGICPETHVIVYDNHQQYGMFSAPRVWWLFRVFGHNKVSVLDGGLKQWMKEGNPVTSSSGPSDVEKKTFDAVLQQNLFKRFEDLVTNLDKGNFQVMDARSEARYTGKAPEPIEGLHRGHLPSSVNVPFMSLFNAKDSESPGLFKSPEDLQQIFASKAIDLSRPLTATCGSGVTACMLALAAHQAGKRNVAVYDGSWEEYAQRATPEQMVVCKPDDISAG